MTRTGHFRDTNFAKNLHPPDSSVTHREASRDKLQGARETPNLTIIHHGVRSHLMTQQSGDNNHGIKTQVIGERVATCHMRKP